MLIEELQASDVLKVPDRGGVLRFAGRRALVLEASALGALRKQLLDRDGPEASLAVLTRFGFVHGWRLAESVRSEFAADDGEWRLAGARLHALGGLFLVHDHGSDPLAPEGTVLKESYEAEQHLLHFGPSDGPVCWTVAGIISGYLSKTEGLEILVHEDRCIARGDSSCRMVARSRKQWAVEAADDPATLKALQTCFGPSFEQVRQLLDGTGKGLGDGGSPSPRDVGSAPPSSASHRSESMEQLLHLAHRVARVSSTILITGESGVGKERIARLVHDESERSGGPFVAVNCGAVTESLLESEFFGHVRGAFTDAREDRPGLFEAAAGGTLFLDEIGDVSVGLQAKLLRVLQERQLRRVGDTRIRSIDVRLLAATNKVLADLVSRGEFRQDLFYRLNVIELHVPALRERRDDILPLANTLLAAAAKRMGLRVSGFTPAVSHLLVNYAWPGNVRQLENAIERCLALATGTQIGVEGLPDELRAIAPTAADLPTGAPGVQTLDALARDHILRVLEANDGNRAETARQLGIGSATLYRKLKSYRADDATPGLLEPRG